MAGCTCFFCANNKEHKHTIEITWYAVSDRLLVAESLDPNDRIKRKACGLCGHIEEES